MSRHIIPGSQTRRTERTQSKAGRAGPWYHCTSSLLSQLNVTEDGQERRSLTCRSAISSRVPDRADTCMSADITWTWHAAGNSTSGACYAWLLSTDWLAHTGARPYCEKILPASLWNALRNDINLVYCYFAGCTWRRGEVIKLYCTVLIISGYNSEKSLKSLNCN